MISAMAWKAREGKVLRAADELPAQQQRLIEAFGNYVSATYADRLDTYSGEQLEVTGERPYGSDVMVQTKIVKSNDETTTLDYPMCRNQGAWQISDVYLDGTVSQVPCNARSSVRSFGERGSMAWSWR